MNDLDMRALRLPSLIALLAVVLANGPVEAGTLIGTQVTGALHFTGYPQNFFDPMYGWVPAGYLNHSGTTVAISSNAVEFGYSDGTTTITADFGATQLTVTFSPTDSGHFAGMQMAFSNAAFSSFSTVSDNFPHGGAGGVLSGDVIRLNWAGGDVTNGQVLAAVYSLNLPTAPLLSTQRTSTNTVVISWPAASGDFNLQQNTNVTSTNWVNVTTTPIVADGLNQVAVSPAVGRQFYRLEYP
jgi:hypothetical protein